MYIRHLIFFENLHLLKSWVACSDAAGSAPLQPSAVQSYLLEAFKWALQGMPRSLGFLDVASLHIKSLTTAQARTLCVENQLRTLKSFMFAPTFSPVTEKSNAMLQHRLDNVSDLCSKKRINLASKDASVHNIVTFHNKIQDLLAQNYPKSPEPTKRKRSAKDMDADEPSSPRSGILNTPISSVAGLDRDLSEAGFLRFVPG